MAAEGNAAAKDAMLQTLNSALGNLGGGQKSWMVPSNTTANVVPAPSELTVKAAPFTVRKRGRPPKNNSARPNRQQPAIEHARPSIEPQADRQPPSNSTSPQLANVVTDSYKTRLQPSAVTVFPSPTPSEENTHILATADLDLIGTESTVASHDPTGTGDMSLERRIGMRLRKPSEEAVVHREKRRRQDEGRQARPTVSASASGYQTPTLSHLPSSISRPPAGSQLYTHSPRLEQTQSRSPSLGQISSDPVQSPQLAQEFQGFGADTTDMPFLGQGHEAPTRPQSMVQSAWYTTQECLHILDAFRHSQASASLNPTERSRLSVLKGAVDSQDWAYVTMHQIYCLLDCDPNSLPVDIRTQPGLTHALGVMRSVLETNKRLSPAVLQFCARFPYQLGDIRARWPATFAQQARMFTSFVSFSPYYKDVEQTCEVRRFPPLAWELTERLGLTSFTFQRLLFTVVLRTLWQRVPGNIDRRRCEAEAIGLFRQNQIEYFQRRYLVSPHPTQMSAENEANLQNWGPRMRAVVEELEHAASLPLPCQVPLPYQDLSPPLQQNPQQNPRYSLNADVSRYPDQAQTMQHTTQLARGPRQWPTRSVQRSHVLASNAAPQHAKSVPLLPPAGWVQPQQRQPNPVRFGLHQTNLQSPVLKARSAESPLYQFVQGFVKPPQRLSNVTRAVEKLTFKLDADLMAAIPVTLPDGSGVVGERLVDTNSRTIRLRCIKWPAAADRPDDHIWATQDTSWIPHSYFSFNGVSLTQRKKVHYGKDLPIDISHLVTEGENTLEMTVMAPTSDKTYQSFLVAIELLGITSHALIKQNCLEKNRIPPEQVLADIRRKLRGSSDDDDITIVESNLTINLFDPFSASKICDIPVRSRACPHPDCFDLETFLQTRRRKGDASMPDLWRCPICNADARPDFLVVDGFMQNVKQQLDTHGLSNIRAIVVQQDGKWQPKAEVREGVSDDPPTPTIRRRSTIPAQSEIIDLSD
jgi:hypothetical protein